MLEAIDACPAPVVAVVQGHALGGGIGLVACADIAIADRGAVFAFSEVKLGIVPAVISPFALRKIGESAARRYFVTGERFDAETALRIGLVHEVTDDLDAALEHVLTELRSAGPRAARHAKRLVLDRPGRRRRPLAGSPSGARATRARKGCARSSSGVPRRGRRHRGPACRRVTLSAEVDLDQASPLGEKLMIRSPGWSRGSVAVARGELVLGARHRPCLRRRAAPRSRRRARSPRRRVGPHDAPAVPQKELVLHAVRELHDHVGPDEPLAADRHVDVHAEGVDVEASCAVALPHLGRGAERRVGAGRDVEDVEREVAGTSSESNRASRPSDERTRWTGRSAQVGSLAGSRDEPRRAPRRVTALLAIASALLIGGADFLGGVSLSVTQAPCGSPRSPRSQGSLFALPAARPRRLGADDGGATSAWSLGAASAVGVGLVLFYTAMARGMISLVAPVTALIGAIIPVLYALGDGERPGAVASSGIVLAVAAIALVSLAPAHPAGIDAPRRRHAAARDRRRRPVRAVLRLPVPDVRRCRPLAGADLPRRGGGRPRSALALATTARARDRPRARRRASASSASLEVGAGVAVLLALQRGPVSVASVLASLYPVTTTFLAALLLRERLRGLQLVGVGFALVAVVLISSAIAVTGRSASPPTRPVAGSNSRSTVPGAARSLRVKAPFDAVVSAADRRPAAVDVTSGAGSGARPFPGRTWPHTVVVCPVRPPGRTAARTR